MRLEPFKTLRSVRNPAFACLLAACVTGCQGEDAPVRGEGSIHVSRQNRNPVPDHLKKQLNIPDIPASNNK